MAGLAYLPGSNENEDVLKCLHQCAESLQIPAVTNSVSSGTEMLIDSKGSVVKVDGKKAKDVASMVNSTITLICYFSIINEICFKSKNINFQSIFPFPYIKVQRVAYLNTREFPVPGRRIARLETQLECENHKTIHIEVRPNSLMMKVNIFCKIRLK